jgi:Fe2+ transport system protein FeoA
MPLSLMKTGEQGRVRAVQGSQEVSRRLTNLGFTAGEPVTVVGKYGSALIVCIRDCRVALDSGAAYCIRVSEL